MTLRIEITLDGLRQVRERINQKSLEASDFAIFGAFVSNKIALEEAKQDRLLARIAADRAAAIAAAAAKAGSEKSENNFEGGSGEIVDADFTVIDDKEQKDEFQKNGTDGTDGTDAAATDKGNSKKKPKGHGRNGTAAYSNTKDYFYTLALGIVGSICAACKTGRLVRHRKLITIRVVGQPMFGAERHEAERARCKVCGRVVCAAIPANITDGIGKTTIYHWSACAMLLVLHYLYGLPFKRIESLHKAWGIPFADANQWQICNESMDLFDKFYEKLVEYAIKNILALRMDDTGGEIISIRSQINLELAAAKALGISEDTIRSGINVSGFFLDIIDGVVLLYYTGRHHAAEVLRELLKHREPGSPKITKVTDGASKNFDATLADKLEEGVCNAHAFLKFHDIKNQFPEEYAVVGEAYNAIYAAEDDARLRQLSPIDRLLLHQKLSRPWMEKIKEMCEAKVVSRLVEPRSPLWEPIHFFINQWPRLTKFLEIPGMPLDTNLCEQALIAPVRYLAVSFNYHTANGAKTGDRAMSLGATARANGVDPVAWFTHCLENRLDLAKNPEKYFPWVYRDRIQAEKPPPAPDPIKNGTPKTG